MALTKITNNGTTPFTIPSGLGGGTLNPAQSANVPYDPQTVGAAMSGASITSYTMVSYVL